MHTHTHTHTYTCSHTHKLTHTHMMFRLFAIRPRRTVCCSIHSSEWNPFYHSGIRTILNKDCFLKNLLYTFLYAHWLSTIFPRDKKANTGMVYRWGPICFGRPVYHVGLVILNISRWQREWKDTKQWIYRVVYCLLKLWMIKRKITTIPVIYISCVKNTTDIQCKKSSAFDGNWVGH